MDILMFISSAGEVAAGDDNSSLSFWISLAISTIISITGFIITIATMKKSFKNELQKSRDSIALEKMTEMPFIVLELLDKMIKHSGSTQNRGVDEYQKMMNTILSYGSEYAITIISEIQKESYSLKNSSNTSGNPSDFHRLIALYILLATQIKYDVTGIAISPDLWFQTRITDYANSRDVFKAVNNKVVEELKLNKLFIIQ